jgi:hypothetical protein
MGTRRYERRVDGRLSEEARAAFVDMRITEAPPQTVIDGEVLDEPHLHGIIVQPQALGITVVSVHPVPLHAQARPKGRHPRSREVPRVPRLEQAGCWMACCARSGSANRRAAGGDRHPARGVGQHRDELVDAAITLDEALDRAARRWGTDVSASG